MMEYDYNTINSIIPDIMSLHNRSLILNKVLESTYKIVSADASVIFTCDSSKGNLIFESSFKFPKQYIKSLTSTKNIDTMMEILKSKKTCIIDDSNNSKPCFNNIKPEYFKNVIIIPIMYQSILLGLLNVYYRKDIDIDDNILENLNIITKFTAISLNNCSLFKESINTVDRLSCINKINKKLSTTIDLKKLLKYIYSEINKLFEAKNFYIAIYDYDNSTISFLYEIYNGKKIEEFTRPFRNGITEYIIQTKHPFFCNTNVDDELVKRGIGKFGKPTKSFLGIPLITSNRVIGVLSIQDYRKSNAYSKSDLELILTLAPTLASSINNALLYKKLNYMAIHDALTDAYNFRHFYEYINGLIYRTRHNKSYFSLLFLDLDDFKNINDTYGHLTGDNILKEYVDLLKNIMDNNVKIFRYGGDEFIIIIEHSKEYAIRTAKKILRSIYSHLFSANIRLTCSIGVGGYPTDSKNITKLIKITDKYMYIAKNNGKNKYWAGMK